MTTYNESKPPNSQQAQEAVSRLKTLALSRC